CARKLASDGAAVVIADLNLANAQQVADSIVAAGGKALAVSMDVTSEEAVNAGIDEAVGKLGGIDVLVSNAGIQIVNPIEDYAYSD
ncbi:SDR family NAD(P)-dependent oxidoreductase, partial [Bacillus sp. SIMBA_031]